MRRAAFLAIALAVAVTAVVAAAQRASAAPKEEAKFVVVDPLDFRKPVPDPGQGVFLKYDNQVVRFTGGRLQFTHATGAAAVQVDLLPIDVQDALEFDADVANADMKRIQAERRRAVVEVARGNRVVLVAVLGQAAEGLHARPALFEGRVDAVDAGAEVLLLHLAVASHTVDQAAGAGQSDGEPAAALQQRTPTFETCMVSCRLKT